MPVAARHQSHLSRIKESVRKTHDYFQENNDRFNDFRRFVFEKSLTQDDCSLLETMGKPEIEFNILEAYISRLLGEFSKQEPSISVTAINPQAAAPQLVELVDMHLRHGLSSPRYEQTKYEIYKDMLSGGFSVAKVRTEYVTPMSFDQEVIFERASDPTLCGFDPLARESHKGDGNFCFELFPMERTRFEEEYPDISVDKLSFRRDFAGFNWSYLNCNIEYLLICDWYEKKSKKVKIVQLRDGRVMEEEKYKKMVAEWQDFTVPPAIIGKPRWTMRDIIHRYRVIENQVIEHEETDYTMLPLVFFDGNSVMVKTQKNANIKQVCRPYVYHARGAQRLKNFAGISLANEIENSVQHKFMVAKEALPKEDEGLQAYMDVQKANVLIYNAFDEQNPDKAIPNPLREVQRVPAPPEIAQAFTGADSLIQNVLGSYDAALGINDNQLSGVAVVEAASQSNAAAMPYLVGFMQGLQRVAEVMVSLFPKYYTTPRTIPVQNEEGEHGYVMINQPDQIHFEYDESALNVMVEAGPAFRVQKSKALQQIVALQSASPMFEQFMATKGLPILLDNLDIRGLDKIKEMANEWMQEVEQQKQMQQQQQQQAMMNDPNVMRVQVEQQKLQQNEQKNAMQHQVDMEKLQVEREKLRNNLEIEEKRDSVQKIKAETERYAKQMELKIKQEDSHTRRHDVMHKHAVNMHKAVTDGMRQRV